MGWGKWESFCREAEKALTLGGGRWVCQILTSAAPCSMMGETINYEEGAMKIVSAVLVIVLAMLFCAVVYGQEAKVEKVEEAKVEEKSGTGKVGKPFDWSKLLAPSIPLFVALGGAITWMLKARHEQLQAAQERLHADRRKLYIDLVSPFIRALTEVPKSPKTKTSDDQVAQAVAQEMTSYEYKKTAFEVIMIGSDEVIRAYNAISQNAFGMAEGEVSLAVTATLWGKLLLEIRKSLGNKKTTLKESETLRWMITDIDNFLDKDGNWTDGALD